MGRSMAQEVVDRQRGRTAPELLAPAGDWQCAEAAVENGADAIYFGLQAGFNARARASNFDLQSLDRLIPFLHRRGVRGYTTLNTLVFTDELPALEKHVRHLAAAGVDAVLVQDLGVARLIREICPDLPIHASTQMTMTCKETIDGIASLGIERVVLARELSIDEIRRIASETTMPLEVFIHGALCVAYSGQCLTSESLGGRSANRGQCAQACRLNYELICDGQTRDLGDQKYLLSPQDLAGYEQVPQLIEAGVCSLKIEGRLKTPEYVANMVMHYRDAIDRAMRGEAIAWEDATRREMELSFSRGFTPGWLEGNDHKRLVPATSSAKRGVRAGTIVALRGEGLVVDLQTSIAPGDGVVLEGNRLEGEETGGRIYELFVRGERVERAGPGRAELRLERGRLKQAEVVAGQGLWLTDDPQLTKRLRQSFEGEDPRRRMPVTVEILVEVGKPISLRARCTDGIEVSFSDPFVPPIARQHPVTEELLEKQLARLGGTAYQIDSLHARILGQPMVPLSVLGGIRRELVQQLDAVRQRPPVRAMADPDVVGRGLTLVRASEKQDEATGDPATKTPQLHVLCRSMFQFESVLEAGGKCIYADFHDIRQYKEAVRLAHQADARLYLATLRISKPGEKGLFLAMAKAGADGWLVRNLAGLQFARSHEIPLVCDFSLNVTNPFTAQWLMQQGALRVTASYDLNRDQLAELLTGVPPEWMEVVIHQHMPMFHMEHCVFCSVISPGTNKTNCGRPCDRHDVQLRDRLGVEHVLHADIGCRNTLFNGVAQSGAEAVPNLLKRGVQNFRIEFLRDAPVDQVRQHVDLYEGLLAGRWDGAHVWKTLRAVNRLGVTRGTLEHPRNPLAIL